MHLGASEEMSERLHSFLQIPYEERMEEKALETGMALSRALQHHTPCPFFKALGTKQMLDVVTEVEF